MKTKPAGTRHSKGVTRRDALKLGATSAVSINAINLGVAGCSDNDQKKYVVDQNEIDRQSKKKNEEFPRGDTFLDHYRKKWTWDYTVRSTHFNNCAYQAHCAFEVYVRDGKVIREEQAGTYTKPYPGFPDPNPRGCQKGCVYSAIMQGPARVQQPLRRKGERGSGQWEEITWEQAIGEIADKVVEVLAEEGSNSIVMDLGTSSAIGVAAFGAAMQFADATDCVVLDLNTEIGDDMQGAAVTYGSIFSARSMEDYFYSDLIICWSGNPAYTQIPNFHYLTEARYRGAKIVVISPDYNATAMHADFWIPVKPGTDAAFALAVVRELIALKMYDEMLLCEQTDLPLLIRKDTRRFLRESDIKRSGSEEQFFFWDRETDRLVKTPTGSLKLGDVKPALEGTYRVVTTDGSVDVEPAFAALKRHVEPYTPDMASNLCGTAPPIIRKFAEMIGNANAACNVESYALGKYHHGDAMMRAQILVFVVAGHLGRRGAGWASAVNYVAPDSLGRLFGKKRGRKLTRNLNRRQWYELVRNNVAGLPVSRYAARGLSEEWVDAKVTANATLFWNVHGGVSSVSNRPWDPTLPKPVEAYLDEALQKGWQGLEPPAGHTPRVFFQVGGNVLRRVRGSQKIREVLWPKLDLVVVTDMRMSTTAREADYFLPVSGFYEKANVGFYSGNLLNVYGANAVVPALGSSKDEWEIYWLLANEIQSRARAKNKSSFRDRHGEVRKFGEFLDVYTIDGKFDRNGLEALCREVIAGSTNLGGVEWETLSARGYAPIKSLGKGAPNDADTDWQPGETIVPYLWHTRDKKPWQTLSGRVQFYIDHPWYLELGEEFPTHKAPPKAGGDYPLMLNSGHTRWSIHALHRTDPLLLRLQRGEPCMYMANSDARERGISEWDRVEVFNDVGSFRVRVKMSPAIPPGMLMLYHAWEDYQHEGGVGHRVVMASPINPIELVGGQPYLTATGAKRQPGMSDRDTRVDVRKL